MAIEKYNPKHLLGISWTSQITNVSGTYILVFGAGETIGTMAMLPLGGALFDLSPFYVVSIKMNTCLGIKK